METNFTENNQLIAAFMGLYRLDDEDLGGQPSQAWFYKETHLRATAGSLKYNTSWDWLMPVVEKIEETICLTKDSCDFFCSVKIMDGNTLIEDWDQTEIADRYGNVKIEYTYWAVVDFIKWYNDIKEKGFPTRSRDTNGYVEAINHFLKDTPLSFEAVSYGNDETDHARAEYKNYSIKIWLPNPAHNDYKDTFVSEIYNDDNDDVLYLQDNNNIEQFKSVGEAVNVVLDWLKHN